VRAVRNLHVRSTARGAVRRVRVACATGNLAEAQELLREASRQLDKAAGKGILHRNAAARRKSRLARLVASLAKKQAEQNPA
jgi:small subunit ribosomal protein S20